MTRARGRSHPALAPRAQRLAAVGVLSALALAPLSAALQPTAARAAGISTSPIQVTLTTLHPLAPQPGDTLVLAGRLRNVSDADVASLAYQLKLSFGPIGNRGEFDDYAADPDGALNDSLLRPVDDVVEASQPTLAPGASEPFELTLDLRNPATLGLPLDGWQVSELGIAVSGTTAANPSIAAVGQLRTFLPWAPRTASGGSPTGVAWIWPLVDRPHRTANAPWFDDALAPELSRSGPEPGRLASLLDAGAAAESQRPARRHATTRNVPVTWAIDPMLVSDVQAMTAGYRVATASGTTAGSGTAAAKSWLTELRGALSRPDATVFPLPYADPDIVAAIREGFTTAIGVAAATGRDLLQKALPGVTLSHFGWPPGGLADQRAINALSSYNVGSVVLADLAVPVTPEPPVTPSAHTVITTSDGPVDTIVSDSGLDIDVNSGLANPNGSRLSIQRFLAETLMIQAERPSIQRDMVVAPGRRWDPKPSYAAALLADTGKVPWIQPLSLTQVQSTPPYTAVQRGQLTYPASARRAELPRSYLRRVASLRNQVGDFGAILPEGNAQIRSYTTALQRALSSAWRQQLDLANDQLTALANGVTAQMKQVQIASHKNSFVTLTSHGGKVPVTISNNLATPVRVTVQLEANERLSLARHGRVAVPIPAHQQVVVNVHAAAKTSGVFPVRVQLFTPSGQRYGPAVQLYVRSTVYGTITLVITGAATAALMIAVVIRLTRRALAARRATARA